MMEQHGRQVGRSRAAGFTLIELLIVVAIIAILAAIAIPNLLEAQARSKVSRELSDMRTIATALEAYCVDDNTYPPHLERLASGVIHFPASAGGLSTIEFVPWAIITTPVAYLTSRATDPCLAAETVPLLREYGYIQSDLMRQVLINKGPSFLASAEAILPTYGFWRLYAAGPDRDRGPDMKKSIPYDPTNGTTSNGDLIRSQKNPVELLTHDEGS